VQTGWTAIVYDDEAGTSQTTSTWLTLSTTTITTPNDTVSGAATGDQDATGVNVILNVPENDTGADRTAYVVVTAGRLRYHVSVTQSSKDVKPYLTVTSDDGLSGNIVVKSNVKWQATWTNKITHGEGTLTNPKTNNTIDMADGAAKDSILTGGPNETGITIPYEFVGQTIGTVELVFMSADTKLYVKPASLVLQALPDLTGYTETRISKWLAPAGAFWKADETGERLIRIDNVPVGKWALQVYQYGDSTYLHGGHKEGFAEGDILFDQLTPSYPFPPADANAEHFQLDPSTAKVAISGVQEQYGSLYFRIGLNSKWSENTNYDSEARPARYAAIVLSYASQAEKQWKNHTIYLRQGHEPDYVYSPQENLPTTDATGADMVVNRTMAMRYSAYNLTMSGAPYNNNTDGIYFVGAGEGIFTDYPTKVGGVFYWAHFGWTDEDDDGNTNTFPNGYSWKYDESNYIGSNRSGYYQGYYGDSDYDSSVPDYFWDDVKDKFEYCPSGYRRWTDGITNGNVGGSTPVGPVFVGGGSNNIAGRTDSEMLQSFWKSAPISMKSGFFPPESKNGLEYQYGFYADGYFDRKELKPMLDSDEGTATTRVGTGSDAEPLAYKGMLIYRSDNCHSLFFPAGGSYGRGYVSSDGLSGQYIGASSYLTLDSDDSVPGHKLFASTLAWTPDTYSQVTEIMLGAYGHWAAGGNYGSQLVGAQPYGNIRCVKIPKASSD
jgi:hypothetical protein